MDTYIASPVALLPPRVRQRLVNEGGHLHWTPVRSRFACGRPQVHWNGQAVDVVRVLAGLLARPDVRLNRRCDDPLCVEPGHFEAPKRT